MAHVSRLTINKYPENIGSQLEIFLVAALKRIGDFEELWGEGTGLIGRHVGSNVSNRAPSGRRAVYSLKKCLYEDAAELTSK